MLILYAMHLISRSSFCPVTRSHHRHCRRCEASSAVLMISRHAGVTFALVWFLSATGCHRHLYFAIRRCRRRTQHLPEAGLAGLALLVCGHLRCQHELAKATDRAVCLHVLAGHQLAQHPDQLWDLLRLPLCVLL